MRPGHNRLCPQQMLRSPAYKETVVSATMCPRLPGPLDLFRSINWLGEPCESFEPDLKGLGHAILGNFSTDQMVIQLTKI